MAHDVLEQASRRRETPQAESARADQVQNSAGGYGFALAPMAQAARFLILGTSGGTYYASPQDLTASNAKVIFDLAESDGVALVELIREVSVAGRAPKPNPALFALAACIASPDLATRQAARKALPEVARTGTHLYTFVKYAENMRGWGRCLKRAVADWYRRDPDKVAFQAVKYRQRDGWSHRDLLRLSHPRPSKMESALLFDWVCRGASDEPGTPMADRIIVGYEMARRVSEETPKAERAKRWAELAAEYRLPWEALPDEARNHAEVWEALLPSMGITALIRNLPTLTNKGLIAPLGGRTNDIIGKLVDQEALTRGRVHPLQVLIALATYKNGQSLRGSNTWTPVAKVVDALDAAFYLAFGAVEPADKRTLIGLDVSASMYGGYGYGDTGGVAGSPLCAAEAAAAMAMVTVRTEPECFVHGFCSSSGRSYGWDRGPADVSGFVDVPISPRQRIDDVVSTMRQLSQAMGATDCAIPMMWAAQNKVEVDTFVIYTDNETWAGPVHPFQALRRYRDIMGIPARLVVVGMTSTGFTIADPTDDGMLDVVGFDTAAPNLINAFSRREF